MEKTTTREGEKEKGGSDRGKEEGWGGGRDLFASALMRFKLQSKEGAGNKTPITFPKYMYQPPITTCWLQEFYFERTICYALFGVLNIYKAHLYFFIRARRKPSERVNGVYACLVLNEKLNGYQRHCSYCEWQLLTLGNAFKGSASPSSGQRVKWRCTDSTFLTSC